MQAYVVSLLYNWASRYPWQLLFYSVTIFVVARRKEDALEVAVGRYGMTGLGLNVLALMRWITMLSMIFFLIIVQLEPFWLPFWTYWSNIMIRIGEGCKLDVKIGTQGIHVQVIPRNNHQSDNEQVGEQ